MTVYRCDKCGAIHEKISEMYNVAINYAGRSTVNLPKGGKFQTCGKCTAEILNILNAWKKDDKQEDEG